MTSGSSGAASSCGLRPCSRSYCAAFDGRRCDMPPLARRNLVHDKVRLAVTLTGIVFAVVLIVVELGLFVGFTVTTSSIIDHSNVDLWIVSKGTPYIEQGAPFSERKLYQVLAAPGVAAAEKYSVKFTQWQTPEGAQESVQVVGFNPYHAIGGP